MGQNCSSIDTPKETNICSNIGDVDVNDSFCSPEGTSGNSKRADHCEAMSSAGEWVVDSQVGSCIYDSCDKRSTQDIGCCGLCCGLPGGSHASCRRVGTYGANLVCCLRDQACTGRQSCFDTTEAKPPRTCAIDNRDESSPSCRTLVNDFCLGIAEDDPDPQNWKDRWLNDDVKVTRLANDAAHTPVSVVVDKPCYHSIYRNLYARYGAGGALAPEACLATPNIGIPTTSGFIFAQNLVNQMMSKYESEGYRIDALEGEPAIPAFNAMIWDICSTTPGLCQNYMKNHCASYTPQTILAHPSSLKWCGCYMSPDIYSTYVDLYQINQECTPICNQAGNLPLVQPDGITAKRCTQSTCVIDNISLDIIDSEIGTLDFEQVCSSCGQKGGSCQCILSDLTFITGGSRINSLELKQKCGGTLCYKNVETDTGTTVYPVPCDTDSTYDPQEIERENARKAASSQTTQYVVIGVIFVIIIIVLIVLWRMIVPHKRSEYDIAEAEDLSTVFNKPKDIVAVSNKIGFTTELSPSSGENVEFTPELGDVENVEFTPELGDEE
jgi:hypothetical protein